MRNYLLAATAAAAVCAAGLAAALGQSSSDDNNRWVTVKNDSDRLYAINIYIMPAGRDCCWSRDLLEDIVIPPKFSRRIKFPEKARKNHQVVNFDDGSGRCIFNVRVTTEFRRWEWMFHEFNVCRETELTLEGKFPVSSDKKTRWMTVVNESRLAAREVYVIQSWGKDGPPQRSDCCWSHNLLLVPEIPKGKSHNVNFDDGSDGCTFDVRITSDKKDTDWYLDRINECSEQDSKAYPKITLKQKPSKRLVAIKNESRVDAINAFIIPEGQPCCWSHNLFGSKIIRSSETLEEVDFDVGSSQCKFEYRIAKSDRSRDWTGKIDFCTEPPNGVRTIPLK